MTTRRLVAFTLVLLALPAGSAAAAVTKSRPGLWATVNLCDPPSKPGAVGIRVSIPREKGAPQQWAHIRLQWFDGSRRAWRRVTSGGDAGWAQAGSRIVLRGVIDIQWRDGTKVVDRAHLLTTAGHRDSKQRQLKVSRASCEIVR
jgi:hypothetical protein